MAIALVNTTEFADAASSASIAAVAASHTTGNLLIVAVRNYRAGVADPSTVTDTAGNTYVRCGGVTHASDARLEIWRARTIVGHAANIVTVTFNAACTDKVVIVLQYSGVPNDGALGAVVSGLIASGGTVTSDPFSTTNPDALIVAAADVSFFSGTWTAGAGYTIQEQGDLNVLMVEHKIVTSLQSNVTAAATTTAIFSPVAILVAVLGATSGGGTVETPAPGAPLELEDPCVPDQEPWIALQVVDDGTVSPEDATTYLASGVLRPINDSTAQGSLYGSRKRPCVLDFGTVRREASDYFTGNWPAQTQSLWVDDANRFWRNVREVHGGDFKQARFWQYLTSKAHRLAGGVPRLLFHGLVEGDTLSDKLGWRLSINDLFGNAYQLHTNDVMIPQRVIPGVNNSAGDPVDFPGFIDPDVRNPRAVPIVLPYSDAAISPPGGAGQAICLGDFTAADASTVVAGLISGHAHKDGVEDLFQDGAILTSYDTDVWAPGKGANWSVKNPSGSALHTDINGNRYTLFFMNGTKGADFKSGSKPVYFNVKGPDTTANGLGTEMTDAFALKSWLWLQHLLPTPPYRSGSYLPTPTFAYSPNGELAYQIDTGSFDQNSITAALYNAGGYVWAGIIGAGGQQQSIRDVIAAMNRSSNSLTTWNEFSQITDVLLDRRRGPFIKAGILTGHPKSGIQKDPPFTVEPRPAWHATNLHTLYAWSEREGTFIADLQLGSNPAPFLKYGSVVKTLELPYVGDTGTATAITQQMLDFMEELPQIARWTRTWCGLVDEVGDGRAITHPLGSGGSGYVDNGFWIHAQDYLINRGRVVSSGPDVERLLTY